MRWPNAASTFALVIGSSSNTVFWFFFLQQLLRGQTRPAEIIHLIVASQQPRGPSRDLSVYPPQQWIRLGVVFFRLSFFAPSDMVPPIITILYHFRPVFHSVMLFVPHFSKLLSESVLLACTFFFPRPVQGTVKMGCVWLDGLTCSLITVRCRRRAPSLSVALSTSQPICTRARESFVSFTLFEPGTVSDSNIGDGECRSLEGTIYITTKFMSIGHSLWYSQILTFRFTYEEQMPEFIHRYAATDAYSYGSLQIFK